MSAASGKWVIKGDIPSEVLFGIVCEPRGGIESTTPNPTRLSAKELAKLKSQDSVPATKGRRKNSSKRAS